MEMTSMLQSRMPATVAAPHPHARWRASTSADLVDESQFTRLKRMANLRVVGVAGFARPWWQLERTGSALDQIIADARATLCFELAERQRHYGNRLVVASGATNQGVLRTAYEVCAFLNINAMGIAPDEALDFSLGQMRYMLPYGARFGDESQVFVRTIDELIVMGGGAQSEREVFAAAAAGRPITVIQGFGGIADRLTPATVANARFARRIVTSRW
jgi:hypothetical protein